MYRVEVFNHVRENRACQPLFVKDTGDSFNKAAGQLQHLAVPELKPKMLVTRLSTIL